MDPTTEARRTAVRLELEMKNYLAPLLRRREANAPPQFVDKINEIIDESIKERIIKCSPGPGARQPHVAAHVPSTFLFARCREVIQEIYEAKLKEFKDSKLKKNNKKLSLGKNPLDVHREILDWTGGKKRRKTKTKRKYTFKKRKGTKKVMKKKRHTRRNQ